MCYKLMVYVWLIKLNLLSPEKKWFKIIVIDYFGLKNSWSMIFESKVFDLFISE